MKQGRAGFLLTVVLSLLVLTSQSYARTYRFKTDFNYDVEENFKLTIDNQTGSISVAPSHSGKLNIHVIKEIHATAEDDAAEIRDDTDVDIKSSPGDVSIKVYYPDDRSHGGFWKRVFGVGGGDPVHVDLEIEVPTEVGLLISSSSADVQVRGVKGEFTLALTSGDIKLSELTGPCQIQVTSGDVEAKDITGNVSVDATSSDGYYDNIDGDLELDMTSGDSEIHWVSGSVRVDKSSGDTHIDKTSGDLDVSSTSGDISINQRSGNLWVKTSSGDIFVRSEMADGNDYDLSSNSGDITLRFPEETKADIEASTNSGDIDTDASIEVLSLSRNELKGRIGHVGSSKRLRLRSSSGDISLGVY